MSFILESLQNPFYPELAEGQSLNPENPGSDNQHTDSNPMRY